MTINLLFEIILGLVSSESYHVSYPVTPPFHILVRSSSTLLLQYCGNLSCRVTILLLSSYATGNDSCYVRKQSFFVLEEGCTISSDGTELAYLS